MPAIGIGQWQASGRLFELETIGHYPQIEAPRRVANAYLSFRNALNG